MGASGVLGGCLSMWRAAACALCVVGAVGVVCGVWCSAVSLWWAAT